MIEGVKVIPLRRIPDERGTIFHMLRKSDEHFVGFGEIYFNSLHQGAVKGWHRYYPPTTGNYAVIVGNIKLVLYDERENSPTKGELMELFIGEENYCLVQIPPMVWKGFKAVGNKTAIMADCCTTVHPDIKGDSLDPHKSHIPYEWKIRDR